MPGDVLAGMRLIGYVCLGVLVVLAVVLLFLRPGGGFAEAGRRWSGFGLEFHGLETGEYFFLGQGSFGLVGADGTVAWQEAVPEGARMYRNGGAVLVSEVQGPAVYVFTREGLVFRRGFSGEVLRAVVGAFGGAAVILLDDGGGVEVHMLDPGGDVVAVVEHGEPGVFPTSLAVSPDGGEFAVALLDASGLRLHSMVDIYREGTVFARLHYGDEVIGRMMYLEGRLVAFSDTSVHSFDIENNMRNSLELDNRIGMVDSMGGGFVVVLGEALPPGGSGSPAGSVVGFGADLRLAWSFYEGGATQVRGGDHGVVVAVGRRLYGIAPATGMRLWYMEATQDFRHVSMLENANTILFATNLEARVLRRGF